MEQVKVLVLTNKQILVSQLDEVAPMDIGDPNCKLIEPFLLNLGFISRTNRGRMATSLAFQHLNIEEEPKQKNLM